jgi:hypothetical protein
MRCERSTSLRCARVRHWLASSMLSSYVTGAAVLVDAGSMAR